VARVLIVDDDPAVTATLRRMLEHAGHAVEQADSGTTALQLAAERPPDAIILDLRMPGLGGLEFLQRLRADDKLKATPVGVLTGDYFLQDQVAAEIESLGATIKYKPVWLDDLTELTRQLLGPDDSIRE
jgi:CheY-like chemotaxis protein